MTLHKWMVGGFLAVVMLAGLTANAVLFSARSFQHNLAQISPSSYGILNVDAFLAADAEITQLEKDTQMQRGRQIALQQAVDRAIAESDAAAKEASALVDRIAADAAAIQERLGESAVAEGLAAADGPSLVRRLEIVAATPELAPQDRQAVARLLLDAQRLAALEITAAERRAAAERDRVRMQSETPLVSDSDIRIMGLKSGVTPDGDAASYVTIRNQVLAVTKASPYGIGETLVQTHPHFLSIALVLLMGLLGGILYLFPAYMSRANPVTFAEILVRMIFGMCTALAFYIVMNAAIAGFSFAPGADAGATGSALNPFSVSLVGIIGGVMADDIAKWIQKRGSEILGQGGSGAAGGLAPVGPAPPPATAAAAPAGERIAAGEVERDPFDDDAFAALRDQLGPR